MSFGERKSTLSQVQTVTQISLHMGAIWSGSLLFAILILEEAEVVVADPVRVRTRISFSFATIFDNLIFFVPFSLTLSQILNQILAIFRQRIILSEKRCSFTDSFNCSNRFKSQYNVKCVGDLKVILALIFKTFAVIN